MGFVLDSILKKDILVGPETVNANFTSDQIDISGTEDDFAVSLVYSNGNSVNMVLNLEVSTDGVNFSIITDSDQAISDASGSHIWDVQGTGATFLRVTIDVIGGSIDVDKIEFTGKRRH